MYFSVISQETKTNSTVIPGLCLHFACSVGMRFSLKWCTFINRMADPGFPDWGGEPMTGEGRGGEGRGQKPSLARFYRKLHENKRNWTKKGGGGSMTDHIHWERLDTEQQMELRPTKRCPWFLFIHITSCELQWSLLISLHRILSQR